MASCGGIADPLVGHLISCRDVGRGHRVDVGLLPGLSAEVVRREVVDIVAAVGVDDRTVAPVARLAVGVVEAHEENFREAEIRGQLEIEEADGRMGGRAVDHVSTEAGVVVDIGVEDVIGNADIVAGVAGQDDDRSTLGPEVLGALLCDQRIGARDDVREELARLVEGGERSCSRSS